MRRIVFLGIALGLACAVLGGLLSLGGCYNQPTPACGFRCGPAGECPSDYTCNESDGRCHLNGSDPALVCGTPDDEPDAGLDSPPDVPPDSPPDTPQDTPPDTPDANDGGTDASDATPD